MEWSVAEVAAMIDHTLLKADATPAQIASLCAEARQLGCGTVCVASSWVGEVAGLMYGTGVRVASTIGFPLGNAATSSKVAEAAHALAEGAQELDVVLHVGRLLAGDTSYVLADLKAVVAAARVSEAEHPERGRVLVKVILECALLDEKAKLVAAQIVERAGADMLKTSTGTQGGATEADVRLLRAHSALPVKAAGGIRTAAQAVAMLRAGATRLGCSASKQILAELGAHVDLKGEQQDDRAY